MTCQIFFLNSKYTINKKNKFTVIALKDTDHCFLHGFKIGIGKIRLYSCYQSRRAIIKPSEEASIFYTDKLFTREDDYALYKCEDRISKTLDINMSLKFIEMLQKFKIVLQNCLLILYKDLYRRLLIIHFFLDIEKINSKVIATHH